MKHNKIVINIHDEFLFYGRVWKQHGPDHVVVIDTAENVILYKKSDLQYTNYKGKHTNYNGVYRWNSMPTLRKLKARAKKCNPNLAWEPFVPKNKDR